MSHPPLDDEAPARAARLADGVGLLPRVEEFSARIARRAGEEGPAGIGSGYLALHPVNQAWRAQLPAGEVGEAAGLLARGAAQDALAGIAPRDAAEGLLAVRMVAAHEAALGCFRRAMAQGQTFEGRQANLGQAGRLTRSYAVLLEALDRHRGKGRPQVVRVERVTVNAGGQAVVGAVAQGGVEQEATDDPMHQRLWRMNRACRCGAWTRAGSPCQSPAVRGKERCRMHGGATGSGGQPGNRNAWRHGGRSGEAAQRPLVARLVREARELVEAVGRA